MEFSAHLGSGLLGALLGAMITGIGMHFTLANKIQKLEDNVEWIIKQLGDENAKSK